MRRRIEPADELHHGERKGVRAMPLRGLSRHGRREAHPLFVRGVPQQQKAVAVGMIIGLDVIVDLVGQCMEQPIVGDGPRTFFRQRLDQNAPQNALVQPFQGEHDVGPKEMIEEGGPVKQRRARPAVKHALLDGHGLPHIAKAAELRFIRLQSLAEQGWQGVEKNRCHQGQHQLLGWRGRSRSSICDARSSVQRLHF